MQTTPIFFISWSRATVIGLLLFLGTHSLRAEKGDNSTAAAGNPSAADYSTPKQTFQTYLKALRANDLAAAKRCWFISDGNDGVLDTLVGKWIAARRLDAAAKSKFTAKERDLLKERGMIGDDYTNEAIDRTLERLKDALIEVCGETASLRIKWHPDDAREEPVFLWCGSRPIAKFRRVNGAWKMDANKEIGFQRPADFFVPESWFYFSPGEVALYNQIAADIEGGKLQTAEQVSQALNAKWAALTPTIEAEKKKKPLGPIDARFFAAWNISLRWTLEYYAGRGSLRGVYTWSRRLLEAEKDRSSTRAEKIAAAEAHLDRMKEARYDVRERAAAGRVDGATYLAADCYRAEAEVLVAEAKGGRTAKIPPHTAAVTRLAAALLVYENLWSKLEKGEPGVSVDYFCEWSRHFLEADRALRPTKADQLAAAAARLERMQELEKLIKDWFKAHKTSSEYVTEAGYHRADAEFLVAQLKASEGKEKKALAEAAKMRLDAAKKSYDGLWARFSEPDGFVSPGRVYEWSVRWRDAALALATARAERVAAAEAHLSRMKKLQVPVKKVSEAGRINTWEFWATEFYIAEAEILLSEANRN